jgi:hypothetical protein
MNSIQFGFAATNSISKIARNQQMSHLVSVLYTALIMFLLMMNAAASRASVATLNNTETTSAGSEGAPVVDKLPPNCRAVDNCGQCFPCKEIERDSFCCDGMAETTSFGDEGVPIVDKLPPNCRAVDNCGECFPCQEIGRDSFCCDG